MKSMRDIPKQDIDKGVKTQIVEHVDNVNNIYSKEKIRADYRKKCKEIREILNESINKEYLKYYFHDIAEEMLNLVIYEVKIMEYCYNYFANKYQIFISREVKEKDFKELKELCYDLIEIVGYFGVLNEKFRVVSHPYYENSSHKDVDLYFKLFEKLKSSTHLFNEKYENLHEFVRINIVKNVRIIGFEGKNFIPKIDHFKEEFGEDFYERTFKIIDKNLCEKYLEKGEQKAMEDIKF